MRFQEVIHAVAECAFVTAEYPVILSLEVRPSFGLHTLLLPVSTATPALLAGSSELSSEPYCGRCTAAHRSSGILAR